MAFALPHASSVSLAARCGKTLARIASRYCSQCPTVSVASVKVWFSNTVWASPISKHLPNACQIILIGSSHQLKWSVSLTLTICHTDLAHSMWSLCGPLRMECSTEIGATHQPRVPLWCPLISAPKCTHKWDGTGTIESDIFSSIHWSDKHFLSLEVISS